MEQTEQAKIDMRTREGRAMRPPMRSDDPRRDASERAKQILEHMGEIGDRSDEFYIDPAIIPEGWGYEWKALSVVGKIDAAKQVELARMGWEPVPTSRHPEMMPADTKEKHILLKDMQLMERPLEVTAKIRMHEKRAAAEQMRSKKEQVEGAPIGPFERSNNGRPIVVNGAKGIKSDFSLSIPD